MEVGRARSDQVNKARGEGERRRGRRARRRRSGRDGEGGRRRLIHGRKLQLGDGKDYQEIGAKLIFEQMANQSNYFAIEGNIGSGKTTLLKAFSSLLAHKPTKVIFQPVELWQKVGSSQTNVLQLFYSNPQKWALPFQIFTQFTRMERWREMEQGGISFLSERSIEGDFQIFGKEMERQGKFTQEQFDLYLHLFSGFRNMFPQFETSGIIYLRTSPEVCFQRLNRRKRPEEASVSLDYLKHLHELHQSWLNSQTQTKRILVLDGDLNLYNEPKVVEKNLQAILTFMGI